jgi:hypothetical protein
MSISNQIFIEHITIELFKNFGVIPEEVVANALKEAGLLTNETRINDMDATNLCNSFINKKMNFKQSTQLGNLLVKNRIITLQQLKDALFEQKKNPALKLGNILITMQACTKYDIEKCIRSQNQIREDLEAIDSYQDKIRSLRQRLSDHH